MRKWRIEDSRELYNIAGWGRKYFTINEKGHIAVTPREGYASVDLKEVMDELQVRDVGAPVLLRFPDILDNRIEKISNCFKKAAKEYDYSAENYLIYPIKVNQMRPVVEELVSHTQIQHWTRSRIKTGTSRCACHKYCRQRSDYLQRL